MKSKRTKQFRALFAELPESVQQQANEAYRLFRSNSSHPSLFFKQVSPKGPVYSVRVGIHYRALAIRQPDCWLWFWIGSMLTTIRYFRAYSVSFQSDYPNGIKKELIDRFVRLYV
jgi:hypothetical protein